VFGTFLSWLQERKRDVFVAATSNDIASLPPEFIRKGRFDEIFFVDLPDLAARAEILRIHMRKRKQDPARVDIAALAAASEGFSGAELEQAVVGGLYSAFASGAALDTARLAKEISGTRPLSGTTGVLLDPIVTALQRGSAEVSYAFFRLVGVPVFRNGFLFSIPGLTIEVARECSGIRSSLSLLLTMLVAGHLFLKKGWNKFFLCLAVVPVTIFKNGVRIVSLTLLGVYVDRRILESELHRNGGVLFFALALALLGGVLWLLRRREREAERR